ncbi:hypothetical protein BD626DRAFT_510895 [Schizophyllum amplum]|uniref:Nucleolus and neural progenitor protein-like N-terminal domain-containing protein n=1 Tax=Schizophyllum amplum TaxID=97359 RepID=A0A550C1M5_9AGAR|nr:hypothetical protein BD626DRAFT_510895 [Auriculariopsis ampla]
MRPGFPRTEKPPKLTVIERSHLAKDSHSAVDAALRDLKKYSRRLHVTYDAFSEELQVLERVFYKGKNQHRSALFWRRVADVRKFSQRIAQYEPPTLLDAFRCSFFGADLQPNSKAMKGAWSYVPDDKTKTYLLGRLSAGVALLNEAHERVLDAYRAFVLEMQSGFFLQLILTLAALSSRLDILVQDLRDALQGSWTTIYELFRTLNPSAATKVPKIQTVGPRPCSKGELAAPSVSQALPVRDEPAGDEDTGVTITRAPEVPAEPEVSDMQDTVPTAPLPSVTGRKRIDKSTDTYDDSPTREVEDTIDVVNIREAETPARVVATPLRPTPASKQPKKRIADKSKGDAPKKKRKKDEIDAIFGF